ncbi:MAG: DUF1850 domain-containing protein [Acidilobaceae archaeon]
MKQHFKKLIPLFFLLIIIILLAPIIPVAEVKADGGLHRFYSMPLNVEVRYTHSVEGLPVIEVLTVEGSCIKVSKIFWPGHGAGMPSATGDIESVEVESGGILYSATLDRCLGSELAINTEYMVNGVVKVGDVIFKGRVEVRVVRISIVNYIFGRLG